MYHNIKLTLIPLYVLVCPIIDGPISTKFNNFYFFNEISEFLLVFAIFCRRHSVMVAGV
jgi:hypothetical protein